MHAMKMFYIARPGGEKQGPFPEATVRANLRHAGFYAEDALVWCKGMEGWMPLREVLGRRPQEAAPSMPAAMVPQTRYYMAEPGGKAQGPFSLPALLAHAYPCTADTLAWHKGMAQWEPLRKLPALALLAPGKAAAPAKERLWQYVFPSFTERGTRGEFLASAGSVAVIYLGALPMLASLAYHIGLPDELISLFCLLVFLLGVVHMFLQSSRRLHDIGLSAAWLAFFAIPLIGWIPYAITMLMPGTTGRNDYGDNPRRHAR